MYVGNNKVVKLIYLERLFSNFCVLVYQLKSVGQIQPACVFVNKILLELVHANCLHIVYGYF